MLSPARLLMRRSRILSGKLQVCKLLGGGFGNYQVVHLLISMETYRTCDFLRGWRSGPTAFIGSAHASSLNFLHIQYLRIFHSVKPLYTAIYSPHVTNHMNNLRCFDETDVRTSQKTTYAQFKIYRTNFIDEIDPWK